MTPRVGRPSVIDADNLACAGIEIVRRDGFESLTFKSLAIELGVSPRSLYNHVDGIDGLRWMVVDALVATLPSFDPDVTPQRALEHFACETRAVLLAHRGCADQVLRFGAMSPAVFATLEGCVRCYRAAGVPLQDAGRCATMFLGWIVAYVIREQAFLATPSEIPSGDSRTALHGLGQQHLFDFERAVIVSGTLAAAAVTEFPKSK